MAARKSKNLLPGIFQTSANEKFLSATLDQVIQDPELVNLNGYIGRQFAPTYKSQDSYVGEISTERENYQLEPSTIIKNEQGEVVFFSSYIDFLNQIEYHGGLINDQSRLFSSELYSFDPKISFDKFVNFGQYYWLPNGPAAVNVNTTGVELTQTFVIARNDNTNEYDFNVGGVNNNTIVLARGGTYVFQVEQDSKFWIQSEIGIDGLLNATPTISSRDVLGVENNGAISGEVIFRVPQNYAQDRFTQMPTVYNVDYAVPLQFSDLQNQYLSNVLAAFPEYAGIVGQFNGKHLIFIGQSQGENLQESSWTTGDTVPSILNSSSQSFSTGYVLGDVVPDNLRFGVWEVQLLPHGIDYLINLFWIQDVAQDEKVYIKYGIRYANTEWYKEFDGFFHRMPLLTSQQNTLYIQDGTNPSIYTTVKIVNYDNFEIDVENDILGKLNYTSPNGVKFTSGLKITFDIDVTPESYRNKTYYVENVGASIRLVDVDLLVTPELFNDELAINYPIKDITLDIVTTAIIPGGSVISIGNVSVTTNSEVPLGSNKITTLDSVTGIVKGQSVSGLGISTGTQVYDIYLDQVSPDYITIKRDAVDLNAWARNNRWFHVDVITATAEYNDDQLIFDQRLRAQRPIVQFEDDLQLYNYGRIGKKAVDILDTDIADAFTTLEGKILNLGTISYDNTTTPANVYYDGVLVGNINNVSFINGTAFGVDLFDGMRVIFAGDQDPLVKNKIYDLNFVQYRVDSNGLPVGPYHIKLTKASDGDIEDDDTLVVNFGQNKGNQYWFYNNTWILSQQKTSLQQDPLFDVYDYDPITGVGGISFSDTVKYPNNNFTGTKIFGYQRAQSGVNDSVLGFPLTYRSFRSQGDISFANYFNTDTFSYTIDQVEITKDVSTGFIQTINSRTSTSNRNTWQTVIEPSKQYQLLTFVYDGNTNIFQLDITPAPTNLYSRTVPYIKVYKNKIYLNSSQWSFNTSTNRLTISANLDVNDNVDVEIYSLTPSSNGHYQIPLNLDLNAQNVDINTLTLGQIRNHLIELSRNCVSLQGNILGPNNLRDIEITGQGGTILQHSAPIPLAQIFLSDKNANFVESVRLAQREYSKFKNKFLELAVSLPGIQPTDPAASVDLILIQINTSKNPTFPWFYSDMVPYGTLKNIIEYKIYDPLTTGYEITNVFSSTELSNTAVLVYLNGTQLILGQDYTFDTDRPAITINNINITLEIDDILVIQEYSNTDGSYIPETPSKLGLWPKFIPEIFTDDTYRTPIEVIRGHDGSLTLAFDDYRDDFLLELEKRIYNNIKLSDTGTYKDIFLLLAGKFRFNEYQRSEVWQVLSKNFLPWVGNNKVDYTNNNVFQSNDAFTWNYANFIDRLDDEYMQGSWRAVYLYFYDTIYPHTRPWEMLGFYIKPDWWEEFYGPAPYTGGNKLLWDDLEAGLIRDGSRSLIDLGEGLGIDPNFKRPGLSIIIPVDENGFLLSPAAVIAKVTNSKKTATAWAVGQLGPVEYAWRISSDFPYAMNQAAAVTKPGKYFGQFIDNYKVYYNRDINQFLTLDNHHIRQTDIFANGDSTSGIVNRSAGYLNWISDYLKSLGIDPATKITSLLKNYEVNLAYKLAGFSDKKYLKVLAEQSSPTSTNDSILIPNENYDVLLSKSTPLDKIVYSAVIIEKSSNGYTVRGYDLNDPYFTIIPSVVNNNAYKITILDATGTVFRDFQPTKLTVPYGYEFKNSQQIVDFLISYERYLIAQGFTFNDTDSELGETRNWKLSVREFLFWMQQGWKAGSILVLSPIVNSLKVITEGSIIDEVTDSQYGSKVVDQNFNLIKKIDYNITRTPTEFSVTLSNQDSVIGFVELNLVQYEHVLRFDNVTVFNDVIYKPELGNRQYRLKLIGQKTDNWDGSLSAPGFIYNSETVQSWDGGRDYLKGDLVIYKNQYYVALQNVAASIDFNFTYWKLLSTSELKTGLLNNFSTIAVGSQSFYDSYGTIKDNNQLQYSHGLIGFRPRQYLSDLGMSETTQIEFYKGYIKQKGTINSIDAMKKAEFNGLSSNINFYEEWAIRTGEYGALESNPFIEIVLDEKEYSVNPAIARFVDDANNNESDGITIFDRYDLYRSSSIFTGNIALNRDEHSNYEDDILTAGYVNLDDVSTTIYDLRNYIDLDNNLDDIGTGYRIWTAKDFTGNWNVYRVSETENQVITLTNSLDGFITWTTDKPHDLAENDIFLIKKFDENFNGFYQVFRVVDLNNIIVQYFGDPANLQPLTTQNGLGFIYILSSVRFRFMEDSRVYGLTAPKQRWKIGDKIWIDDDAATTLVQGQSVETSNGGWRVYEKTAQWNYQQTLQKATSEYVPDDGYGTAIKLSYDGLLATVGSPFGNSVPYYNAVSGTPVQTGKVNTFDQNADGIYVEGTVLVPDGGNASVETREYGYSVDQAINRVVIGAPGSSANIAAINYANIGFVYAYYRSPSTTTYFRPQILWSSNLSATNDRFGSSLSFDQNGTWLYVGAPGNDRVYIYGLNTHVSEESLTISINDKNILNLSNVVTVSPGALITQPSTGATATVVNVAAVSSNIVVTTRTGFITGNAAGNIYINNVDSGSFANIIYNFSTCNSINTTDNGTFGFVPNVSNAPDSLSITNSQRTFIPNLDYTVSGNTISFVENLREDTYVIEQKPYYTLHAVLQGPSGSQYGYALDSSLDGAQLAVGAPNDSVTVNGNVLVGAGAVYVYDRVVEAFNSTGSSDYVTVGNIDLAHRVTIDEIETTNYTLPGGIGSTTVRFNSPPPIGKVIYIETNQFNLLEKLVGIDSLDSLDLSAVQANAAFGTSLTICSNNCAIYVGAPTYSTAVNNNNSGAVWKFHNRGRLYGTDTGYAKNPVFLPGDSFRLDNFLITVQGRLMPTSFDANTAATILSIPSIYISANILAISSNVVANVGQVISQNLGSGYYANVVVLSNTSPTANTVVGSQFITVGGNIRLNGYITANVFNYGIGNVVTIYPNTSAGYSGTVSSAYPMASLDSLIKDINDADLLGITATNENGYLRLDSNKTIAKNLLRILSGNNLINPTGLSNVYDSAKLSIFAFMQIIVNPFNAPGEYFGNKVVLAQNAYMLVIGSKRGTTRIYTTFDVHADLLYPDADRVNDDGSVNTNRYVLDSDSTENSNNTMFDQSSTAFFDAVDGSGSVYVYELYDDPRNEVENPGRYSFAQQLNTGDLNTGDRFGEDLDIIGTNIIVSAPGDDTVVNNAGSIYIFSNPTLTRGWNLIRYQEEKVDVDSVNRMYLYNTLTNTILTNLEFIDPAKGKILGLADQEITWKTEYDPAVYNRGNLNVNTSQYWGEIQVDKVWWNLNQVRFVDYEQSNLTYRSINWGRLFPGSIVEVCEWVQSPVLPSQYVEAGYDGIPKYADDSAYVEVVRVDPNTNIIGSIYYFWVTDKTSVNENNPSRSMPISSVADYITNPKAQGIPYGAIIHNQALILYNIAQYLTAQNTVLHLDFDALKNTSIIHSEYELLQKAGVNSDIPIKISNKLIDSLAGIDSYGSVVPDPLLNVADRYGLNIRPRQSMFIDRLRAMSDLISYVNTILIQKPIAREYNLDLLNAEESIPNFKLGEYDIEVATEIDLDYIDTIPLPTGYKVLVRNNTAQDNLWTLHELQSDDTWDIVQVQSYKTNLYWRYVDWYAPGFESTEVIEYVVDTLVDALKLPVAVGDEILVKVTNSVSGGFNILTVLNDGTFQVVGIENGTIQLDESLGNFANNGIGLGNQGFDSNRFDQSPNVETRYIIQSLRDDIFTGELDSEFNKLFFVMINYLFTEQKYVDWIFKTSFTSVTHYLRTLGQPANYIKDNINYFEDYINEIKPYRTKLREYLINYNSSDTYQGSTTDFDLAPYYDTENQIFRSPSGEQVEKDEQLWATGYLTSTGQLINLDYPNWYNNRNMVVDTIVIENAGLGYIEPPTITISGGGIGVNAATATATINGDTGAITSITVTDSGSGYYITPTVVINGSTSGNVSVIFSNIANASANTYNISSTVGLFVGMYANTRFSSNTVISSIDTANSRISLTAGNTSSISNIAVSFGFSGSESGVDAKAYPILKNSQIRIFDTSLKFDRISYNTSVKQWAANTKFAANTIVSYDGKGYKVLSNTNTGTKFIGSGYSLVSANVFSNANDRIMAYYSPTDFMPRINDLSVTLTTVNAAVSTDTIYVFPQDFTLVGMYITGNGVESGNVRTVVGNVNISISNIATKCTQIKLSVNVTLGAGNSITATTNTFDQLIPGTTYPKLPITGPGFVVSPLFGVGYDNSLFDPVSFDRNGQALLSNYSYDTIYYSYLDQILGTAPEDLITIGGDFIDTYHSRAPEELVPGTTFDTLDMKVYTSNVTVDSQLTTVAYRMFQDMTGNVGFYRISDNYSTSLTQPLSITNSEIYLEDTTVLFEPNTTLGIPGVVFINGERITYWRKYSSEVTAWTANTAISNSAVISNGGIVYITQTAVNSVPIFDHILYRKLTLSGNITANVGQFITQANSTANAEIVLGNISQANLVTVKFVSYSNTFDLNAGNLSLGGTLIIDSVFYANASNVAASYWANSNVTVSATTSANVRVLPSANVLAQIRRGTLGTAIVPTHNAGTVVIDASHSQLVPTTGNVIQFANIWYNSGANIATDGTGFEGSTTTATLFLKEYSAGNVLIAGIPDELTTEDAINTLTTEDSNKIIEEN